MSIILLQPARVRHWTVDFVGEALHVSLVLLYVRDHHVAQLMEIVPHRIDIVFVVGVKQRFRRLLHCVVSGQVVNTFR